MDRPFPISSDVLTRLRRRLLAWFDRHARDLPWRRTRDPYAIWVSEIMLQQTQVATVIPYFDRFCRAFPDVGALARAEEQQVLRLWEGLGYYRRAHSMHEAARLIAAEHQGLFPRKAADLSRLPGLGRYTVNAVLSQAFDARLPIVEANSERVLCRLLGVDGDPKTGEVRRGLWDSAARLLPRRRAGAFNQALMELGALVCKLIAPNCQGCPLGRWCRTKALGLQEKIPRRAAALPVENIREVALVIERRGKVLWTQRPNRGRWPAMWEFPHLAMNDGEDYEPAAQRLLERLGVQARLGQELASIRHAVTRFRITLGCHSASYRSGRFRPSDQCVRGLWLSPWQLHEYPVSVPQRKLVRLVTAARQGRLF